MKTIAILAAMGAALCLSACASTSAPSKAQVDNAVALADATFQAAKTTVAADASAGIIDAKTAAQIEGYITAGDQALAAAQAAYAAGDATTEQDRVKAIIQASADINNAILIAVTTRNQH